MKKKKRKITRKKKKFFIILACYIATFVITAAVTLSTLAWFNSSTHADNVLYMGGPVYMHFSDAEGTPGSGEGELEINMPPNWEKLYPGMNIEFEARAIIEGASWQKEVPVNETITIVTTGAILRARVMLSISDPSGAIIYPLPEGAEDPGNTISKDIYDWIWPQLQDKAVKDNSEEGAWVFDNVDEFPEDNYFYYVEKGQTKATSGEYQLKEVGGVETNVSVGFLNKAVVTLPPLPLTNLHADCRIKFTVVFHALQAFLPYEEKEVGVAKYVGDNSGRLVNKDDVGMPKPLTIANSRSYYAEAFAPLYPGDEEIL